MPSVPHVAGRMVRASGDESGDGGGDDSSSPLSSLVISRFVS